MHFFVQYPLELSLLETKYNHNVGPIYAANYSATPLIHLTQQPGFGGNTVKGAKKLLANSNNLCWYKNNLQNTTFCIESIFITKCMLLGSQRTYKKREVLELQTLGG